MMSPGKIVVAVYIICLSPFLAFAQQFNYTASLNRIDTTGFYAIAISSQISAYIKTDFADIRIADEKKQWVPHILQRGGAVLLADSFTQIPILQNTITDSGKNLLILENTKAAGINNLKLFLKNSAVSRTAVLSGSNNQQEWFSIAENIAISRSYETVKDEYLQEINFPIVTYRYLKIVIDNSHNDPLRVTKGGFYFPQGYKKLNIYLDNPIPVFTQKDSNNSSFIEVRQDDHYKFDRISLSISGAKFYNRDVEICLPYYGKNEIPKPGIIIGHFKLLSALPAIFELAGSKSALFFIVIKNADNPPLKIDTVITQQQTVSLIAYLEKGKRYDLLFGDSLASFADYDLPAFKDSITMFYPLSYGKFRAVKKFTLKDETSGKNRWIWPTIIFAGIMLCILTYRLTSDINKSKK